MKLKVFFEISFLYFFTIKNRNIIRIYKKIKWEKYNFQYDKKSKFLSFIKKMLKNETLVNNSVLNRLISPSSRYRGNFKRHWCWDILISNMSTKTCRYKRKTSFLEVFWSWSCRYFERQGIALESSLHFIL